VETHRKIPRLLVFGIFPKIIQKSRNFPSVPGFFGFLRLVLDFQGNFEGKSSLKIPHLPPPQIENFNLKFRATFKVSVFPFPIEKIQQKIAILNFHFLNFIVGFAGD
jgi:hypothetical protein